MMTSWLYRLVQGDLRVAAEVKRRAEKILSEDSDAQTGLRTVSVLRARASEIGKARKDAEAKRREEERLRRERLEEEKRRARLRDLRLRGEDVWRDIENEINRKNASAYDSAAALISDLRILAEENGTVDAFSSRLDSLRSRHRRKGRFLERLDELEKF